MSDKMISSNDLINLELDKSVDFLSINILLMILKF